MDRLTKRIVGTTRVMIPLFEEIYTTGNCFHECEQCSIMRLVLRCLALYEDAEQDILDELFEVEHPRIVFDDGGKK